MWSPVQEISDVILYTLTEDRVGLLLLHFLSCSAIPVET